jgi:hypothetical protein
MAMEERLAGVSEKGSEHSRVVKVAAEAPPSALWLMPKIRAPVPAPDKHGSGAPERSGNLVENQMDVISTECFDTFRNPAVPSTFNP